MTEQDRREAFVQIATEFTSIAEFAARAEASIDDAELVVATLERIRAEAIEWRDALLAGRVPQ